MRREEHDPETRKESKNWETIRGKGLNTGHLVKQTYIDGYGAFAGEKSKPDSKPKERGGAGGVHCLWITFNFGLKKPGNKRCGLYEAQKAIYREHCARIDLNRLRVVETFGLDLLPQRSCLGTGWEHRSGSESALGSWEARRFKFSLDSPPPSDTPTQFLLRFIGGGFKSWKHVPTRFGTRRILFFISRLICIPFVCHPNCKCFHDDIQRIFLPGKKTPS